MSAGRTGTMLQDPHRDQSAANIRTSHFLKKVSNIRTPKRKNSDSKQLEVCERGARSMDLGSKDFAMLNNQHATLRVNRGESPVRYSSETAPESRNWLRVGRSMTEGLPANVTSPLADSTPVLHLRSVSDSTPPLSRARSQDLVEQIGSIQPRDGFSSGRGKGAAVPDLEADPVPSAPNVNLPIPAAEDDDESLAVVPVPPIIVDPSDDGPDPTALASRASPPTLTLDTSGFGPASSLWSSSSEVSPGLSGKRDLAPRLATLPPPMMASYTAKGAARLTPSIITRHPPMPILNLPTLPSITPTPPVREQAPLRSIPALPMRGPSETEREGDQEGDGLLEEDEDEDEGYDDASPGIREPDAGASDEDDADESADMTSPASRVPRSAEQRQIDSHLGVSTEVTERPNRASVYLTPRAYSGLPAALTRPGPSSVASDYFSSKKSDRDSERSSSPTRTPRPSDYINTPSLRTPVVGNGPQIIPMPNGSPRPGLYQFGSRSMVDLLSTKGKDKLASPIIGADSVMQRRRSKLPPGPPLVDEDASGAPSVQVEPEEDESPASPTLRRQRSLPTYKMSSNPPPYPSFHPRRGPAIQPRDEEGKERLPSYSNSIHLAVVMPRKLEFTAPGIQAKDRKWRRVLCVLEGTAFKVYKCPPGAAGVSAIEEWWEKKVGVGDITVSHPAAAAQPGIRVSAVRGRTTEAESQTERPRKADNPDDTPSTPIPENSPPLVHPPPPLPPPPSRSKLHITNLLHPSRSSHFKNSGATATARTSSTSNRSTLSTSSRSSNVDLPRPRASMDPLRTDDHSMISVVPRASVDVAPARSSYASTTPSRVSTSNSSPSATDSSSIFSRSRLLSPSSDYSQPNSAKSVVEPSPKDLLRAYTLQHAESGLASDYLKRKNVIRVRVEGEQFLLQAQDVASVIEWIEGIQAATNISLDLDERPMPRGPMFPRRRRRRARTVAASTEIPRSSVADATPTILSTPA
ncbi:uncharacterized protein FIBRA_00211 [Fibroporia radiculosa]|uniref:PH domain-containing protein n=1 Tax=Fibroporia radiculosa TaxID=599839 RepID=J7RGM2_9APHY|nr:uncharacterized protein FIBRA_00211 [Fibroporia radiculosa]CCL98217.1 predicted protein [Fibroporia radiculosa]